jgi:hypothetical protein
MATNKFRKKANYSRPVKQAGQLEKNFFNVDSVPDPFATRSEAF